MNERHSERHNERRSERRVRLREAAEILGVSVDAVRMRAKRGTLRSEKEGGRVYVWVHVIPNGDQNGVDREPKVEAHQLLAALRNEIDIRRRESERKDAIIMALSQSNAELSRTIQAIEAPGEQVREADPRTSEPAERHNTTEEWGGPRMEAPRTSEVVRGWWRWWFG